MKKGKLIYKVQNKDGSKSWKEEEQVQDPMYVEDYSHNYSPRRRYNLRSNPLYVMGM